MPNIKSAKIRVKQSELRNQRNKAVKTFIRHLRRDTAIALEKKEISLEEATTALNTFKSKVDKAWTKGVFPRNTTSRMKSAMEVLFKKSYAG
ncbi:MAG: 30S ribosomal protein S20 [Brevinema sp.]